VICIVLFSLYLLGPYGRNFANKDYYLMKVEFYIALLKDLYSIQILALLYNLKINLYDKHFDNTQLISLETQYNNHSGSTFVDKLFFVCV